MLEENSGSESQVMEQDAQTESSVDGTDYRESFNQEKAYSQKMRARAQQAEAELQKLKARNKKIEEDSLIEQNKYKELWEKDKTDAEWARGFKKTQRAKLLDSLPEDKREKFENMNLKFDALQAIVEEFSAQKKSVSMKAVPGQVGVKQPEKPYSEMTEKEKRAYYEAVAMSRIK